MVKKTTDPELKPELEPVLVPVQIRGLNYNAKNLEINLKLPPPYDLLTGINIGYFIEKPKDLNDRVHLSILRILLNKKNYKDFPKHDLESSLINLTCDDLNQFSSTLLDKYDKDYMENVKQFLHIQN